MKEKNGRSSDSGLRWLAPAALMVLLYMMYSSVFLSDYLMNDEWSGIGSNPGDLIGSARHSFFYLGRSLYGIYHALVYRFAGYDPFRVQCMRFLNFASLAVIAAVLFRFVEGLSRSGAFAFFTVLFFYCQPSFQSAMGYSLQLIANTQPAMWLSLLAFYLHFYAFRNSRVPRFLRIAAVFCVLMLAMQSTQTYAFFAMVPLTYLALTEWDDRRGDIAGFLILAFVVFLLSAAVYKVGLDYWHGLGEHGYALGERGVKMAVHHPLRVLRHALNPFAYWGAFEIWSYPFPFHYTPPLKGIKREMAYAVLVVWAALVAAALVVEAGKGSGEQKRRVIEKWLAVAVCLGFGAIFLIADSPMKIKEHRPHLALTFAGVVIFCGAYSIRLLASRFRFLISPLAKSLGILLVLMSAAGAQADVLRGYVNVRMEQLDFIRTELMSGGSVDYKNVIVVLPDWRGCVTEPCGPWRGYVADRSHITMEGGYRYAMKTIGISPDDKEITFVDKRPDEIPKGSVVIDWDKYTAARKRLGEYLGR